MILVILRDYGIAILSNLYSGDVPDIEAKQKRLRIPKAFFYKVQ